MLTNQITREAERTWSYPSTPQITSMDQGFTHYKKAKLKENWADFEAYSREKYGDGVVDYMQQYQMYFADLKYIHYNTTSNQIRQWIYNHVLYLANCLLNEDTGFNYVLIFELFGYTY